MVYKCTGIAIVKSADCTILSYTLAQYDSSNNLIKSNIRKSYPIKTADSDLISAVNTLEMFICSMENTPA